VDQKTKEGSYMKNILTKTQVVTTIGLFIVSILLVPVTAPPVFAQRLGRGSEGTLGCIGNHRRRLGGTELTSTGYSFRNFNSNRTLIIDDITIFAADGTTLATMPPFPAGFTSVLGPNESTNFNTTDIFGTASQSPRPLQLVVNWRSANGRNGLELWGNTARKDQRRDPAGPDSLEEQRSRGNLRCATLKLRRADDDDDD